MKIARVFARNFMTRGLRHGFGMTRGCRPSNGFGPRFGQRAFLIDRVGFYIMDQWTGVEFEVVQFEIIKEFVLSGDGPVVQ